MFAETDRIGRGKGMRKQKKITVRNSFLNNISPVVMLSLTSPKLGKEQKHISRYSPERRQVRSEVMPLDLESLAILQITIHDLGYRVRKPHAHERIVDFVMPVYPPQFEEATSNDSGVLCGNRN